MWDWASHRGKQRGGNPACQKQSTHKDQNADQGPQADPGGSAASGTQFGGAGMLVAVEFAAVPAGGLGQALTFIASGRLVVLGDLRPPPARPAAFGSQRPGADPVLPQVSFCDRCRTAGTVDGAVRGTKQLPAGKTAAHRSLVAKMAIHL